MSTWGNHPLKKVGFHEAPNVQFASFFGQIAKGRKKWLGQVSWVKK